MGSIINLNSNFQYFEKDLANNTKDHIFLNNVKLATINNTSSPFFVISDHLGSNSLITDNSGNIIEKSEYDPYGKSVYSNQTQSTDNQYKYTGKELDTENTLQYFGARYLDNNTARFYSVDPATIKLYNEEEFKRKYERTVAMYLSDPQNLNTYAYALNNPVKQTDPDGEIVPLLAGLYVAFEVGMTLWDTYNTGNVLFGENRSSSDKAWSGGSLVAGLVLPGPGGAYTKGGQKILSHVDDVALGRIEKSIAKISNTIKDHLKEHDYAGLIRDLSKNPLWSVAKNRYFDHYDEVISAKRGLEKNINNLKNILNEYDLDKKIIDNINESINEASQHLDRINKILRSH